MSQMSQARKHDLDFVSPLPLYECGLKLVNYETLLRKVDLATVNKETNRFYLYTPLAVADGYLRRADVQSTQVIGNARVSVLGVLIAAALSLVFVILAALTQNAVIVMLAIILAVIYLAFVWYLATRQRDGLVRLVKRALEYQDKPIAADEPPPSTFQRV